jgi:hypothetical protein
MLTRLALLSRKHLLQAPFRTLRLVNIRVNSKMANFVATEQLS